MEINLKDKAVNELEDLSEESKEEIFEVLEEFEEEQFHHQNVKQIKDRDGKWIWRLKIKKEHTDHRAFIDYIDGEFEVLSIAHRDFAYEK